MCPNHSREAKKCLLIGNILVLWPANLDFKYKCRIHSYMRIKSGNKAMRCSNKNKAKMCY